MKSMTGFGSGRTQTETSVIELNVKSVNGRFLETRFHLPREFWFLESELKKELQNYFHRGTIDILVTRRQTGRRSNLKMIVHEDLAQEWVKASQKFNKKFKLDSEMDSLRLLQLPDVVQFEEQEIGLASDAKAVKNLFSKACGLCHQERKREGQGLQKELVRLLQNLKGHVREMAEKKDKAASALKERFESKVLSKAKDFQLDPARLYQEVVLQLEKADIQEELARLTEHLQHFEVLLKSSEPQGKKLDFYSQELLREVNTIGSKSQLTGLTKIVVTAKAEIEKIKEQVQNIE